MININSVYIRNILTNFLQTKKFIIIENSILTDNYCEYTYNYNYNYNYTELCIYDKNKNEIINIHKKYLIYDHITKLLYNNIYKLDSYTNINNILCSNFKKNKTYFKNKIWYICNKSGIFTIDMLLTNEPAYPIYKKYKYYIEYICKKIYIKCIEPMINLNLYYNKYYIIPCYNKNILCHFNINYILFALLIKKMIKK